MQNRIKNISIIGSGNVAAVLGRLLHKNGYRIIQVVSRNATAGKGLAEELEAAYVDFSGTPDSEADMFLIALSDAAISTCFSFLSGFHKLVVHTAASVPMVVLKEVSDHYGVIYPLQTLRKETTIQSEIPFFYCANSTENEIAIKELLYTISENVSHASDEERLKYHVAAVLVCNFTNHLYALAASFCKDESLEFSRLKPLIEETALRLRNADPSQLQTGPAVRKDHETMQKHLELLKSRTDIYELYKTISSSVMNSKL